MEQRLDTEKQEVLDWTCRSAAIRGAFDAEFQPPAVLFVNVEPIAAGQRVPHQYAALAEQAWDGLRVVFEFTERALTDFPGEVLYAVRALRKLGAMIALDDVGIDPRSLALLPFLEPEVVKLDMSLTHDPLSRHFSEAQTPHGRVDNSGLQALWSTLLQRAATMEAATVVLASQSLWNPSVLI